MAGYEAIFEATSGKKRLSVPLKIANTTARVRVSSNEIKPLIFR